MKCLLVVPGETLNQMEQLDRTVLDTIDVEKTWQTLYALILSMQFVKEKQEVCENANHFDWGTPFD